jgi:hypothetical protein
MLPAYAQEEGCKQGGVSKFLSFPLSETFGEEIVFR